MAERLPIVVYGASGFTGRLICAELVRRGVRFAISGRDASKLEALATRLGGHIEVLVAPLDARGALERMAARARVVLDCAGPFARYGRAVQDAALEARSHFLDITGEAGYMQATAGRDAEARARGVALVNSVGFDVVPTDAAAVLCAEALGWPVDTLRLAFAIKDGRPTQGTTRSALLHAHHGGLAYVDGRYRREPVGASYWDVPFSAPIGPRRAVSIPWGDLATAPRSTGAQTVRTFTTVPRRYTPWVRYVAPLGRLLEFAPVQALAERFVRRLPEGPSDDERARSRFAVVAEATAAEVTRRAWVTGGDTYVFTAAAAALCAEWAARPDFARSGALTPTQAFGAQALLDTLAEAGVRYGVE